MAHRQMEQAGMQRINKPRVIIDASGTQRRAPSSFAVNWREFTKQQSADEYARQKASNQAHRWPGSRRRKPKTRRKPA
jgi:hypothetical protein